MLLNNENQKMIYVSDTRTNVEFFFHVFLKKKTSSIYMLLPRSGQMTTVWNCELFIRTLWFLLLQFFFRSVLFLIVELLLHVKILMWMVNRRFSSRYTWSVAVISIHHIVKEGRFNQCRYPHPGKKIRTRQNLEHTRCTCISFGLFMPLVYIILLPSTLFVLKNLITIDKKEV